MDDAEDYSSVWESVPGTPAGRLLSGGLLRPEWEGELVTSFEWQRNIDGRDRDRDSASGTMPKSPAPGKKPGHSSNKWENKPNSSNFLPRVFSQSLF